MPRKIGEVWEVDLTDARGHEQSGIRPAIILGPWVVLGSGYGNLTIVVPTTTTANAFSFPHIYQIDPDGRNGLSSVSAVLLFQILALDDNRFIRKRGIVSSQDMAGIKILLKDLLKIDSP